MLTDMTVEEEFEVRDKEPWYDKEDLEHDLHLAAELGKTLLERNHELEQGLQQMYSTNQEQLQEIEYLTKQVDLLRHMNDQHAKVYEQLDMAARDLEQGNHRLVQENRLAQHKINSLTETIEGLQSHLEELQAQVEELTAAQNQHSKREVAEQHRILGAQSVSCLKELYNLQRHRYLAYESLGMDQSRTEQGSIGDQDPEQELDWDPEGDHACVTERDWNRNRDPDEEHATLQRSVQTLQTQLSAERGRREAAEQEAELTARENEGLEQRLVMLEGCRSRQKELEEEVEELRLLWRADYASSAGRPVRLLLPDSMFFTPEEKINQPQGEEEQEGREKKEEVIEQEQGGRNLQQRRKSEGMRRGSNNAEEIRRGHELMCIRRAEAVKQRGISLLNEVDAQYSALQVKYEELLKRCQQGGVADGLSHKSVQTLHSPSHLGSRPRGRLSSTSTSDLLGVADDNPSPQPEYKVLFQEIFSRIHKTKEDLGENRHSSQGH